MSMMHGLAALLLALLGAVVAAQAEPPRQVHEMVVMINGSFLSGGIITGAGIVVAETQTDVYIATARHVVDRSRSDPANVIEVEFFDRRGIKLPARLAEVAFPREADLAVLIVDGQGAPALELRKRPRIWLSRPLTLGEPVWMVGQSTGEPWARSSLGEPVSDVGTTSVKLDSNWVAGGMSGGGAFDADGLLVGMVIRNLPPTAELLPAPYLAELIRRRLPFDLVDAAAEALKPPASQALVGSRLPVRSEPNLLSQPFLTLRQGDRVTVLDETEPGWYRVRMTGDREGYVPRSADLRFR